MATPLIMYATHNEFIYMRGFAPQTPHTRRREAREQANAALACPSPKGSMLNRVCQWAVSSPYTAAGRTNP